MATDDKLKPESAIWLKDAVDKIYMDDNFYCCTTDKFEIWHVGDCCVYRRGKQQKDPDRQLIFCGDLWDSPALMKHHMKNNIFLDMLEKTGQSCCIIESRSAHLVWGHGNKIFDIRVPESLREDIVLSAKYHGTYSKSNIVGIFKNNSNTA